MTGRSPADFHCHSSRSDGTLAPADLVALAARNGVRYLALTDHDTVDGLDEARAAAAQHPGFVLVPGVELACDVPGTEVHLLGLFVDDSDDGFRTELDRMRKARIERGERIVSALAGMGAPVSWQRVREIAGEASIGRPHIARALIETGYAIDVDDAFARFLGRESPAYVERERLLPGDAIALVHSAGGFAVFAHPPFTRDYEQVATGLAAAGLDGMEVYYRHYDPAQVEALRRLAEQLGLTPSGGSDYHGLDREHEHEPGTFAMPPAAIEGLLAAARARGCAVPEPAGDVTMSVERETEPVGYCERHPEVETALECGRCGTPICPRCLVHTPGGIRCPDCAKLRRLPMYELAPLDYAKAAAAGGALAGLLGFISAWILPVGGFRGFFLILALFVGSGAGALVAEALLRVTGGKRGPVMQGIALATLVAALVVRLIVSGAGIEGVLQDMAGLLIVGVAAFAAWGRLR